MGVYGKRGLFSYPANYYLLPNFMANAGGVPGLNRYDTNSQFPHIGFNASGSTQTFGAIVWPANTIDVHPAPGEMGIIAWHSLVNGYISISGLVSDNSPGCGDGILWYIDKNSTTIASGGYVNGGSQTFASGTNGADLNSLAVIAGDVIYLAIHPNGEYTCDDGLVDLTINVTSAPTPTSVPSVTPTITKTPTITLTPSRTPTATITYTPSRTPTITRTPTKTPTASRTPTATRTPTITRTPTKTSTASRTPTASNTPWWYKSPTPSRTFTPTITPTSTATSSPTSLPPPNSGGSGTCWESAASWQGYTVSYIIDRNTIPVSMGWDSSINAAAQTWNDVTPSHFVFIESTDSGNVISYGQTQKQDSIAEVSPDVVSFFYITQKSMVINSNIISGGVAYSIDTNNIPDPNNPDSNGSATTVNLQNALTHEFGHFLQLNHPDNSCSDTTMYEGAAPGEIKKITLDAADKDAINWQYP